MSGMIVTIDEIKEAQKIVNDSKDVFRTPLFRSPHLEILTGSKSQIFLKCESMQNTGHVSSTKRWVLSKKKRFLLSGSFKIRGLVNVMEKLPDAVRKGPGVVTMCVSVNPSPLHS